MCLRKWRQKIGRILLSSILAGSLYLGISNKSYAQEPKLRVKEEVTLTEDKEKPDYLSILSLEDEDFKLGIRNLYDSNNTTFGLKGKTNLNENTGIEATILGDNDNKLKLRLESRLSDFHLGFLHGKSETDKLNDFYGRFEKDGNVLGLGFSESNGKKELNYFGVLDWKEAPLVKELLLSGGTSGIGSDNYFLGFRVPNQKERDYGYEGYAIFDKEELQFYKFRFAYGNARMGAIGHFINTVGTGPRVANIDAVNSVINETDMFYPLALELWERGEYGLEISGKDDPKIEVTFNPKGKGNWIGGMYDTSKNKFLSEGGVNIRGFQLKAVSDLRGEHLIRLEKTFTF